MRFSGWNSENQNTICLKNAIFSNVTVLSLVQKERRFGGTYCLCNRRALADMLLISGSLGIKNVSRSQQIMLAIMLLNFNREGPSIESMSICSYSLT
jgi:hypothetical protein